MRLKNADVARIWLSKLKQKRSVLVRFCYGATKYVLEEAQPIDKTG